MYVYLCTGITSSTHKSTSIKMYRESSSSASSIESFECSYLTPTDNNEISVEKNFNNLYFSFFGFCFSFEKQLLIMLVIHL